MKHTVAYLEELRGGGLPGCCIVVKKNHETVFEYESGLAKDQKVFLYSCSKMLTITSAMRLVEKGKLNLDDPVKKYLPAFADVFIMKDGKACPPEKEMTIRNLMSMTSGMDYNLSSAPICEALEKGEDSTVELVCAMSRAPLNFSPGDKYLYSLSHDVLAAVVEVISEKPFREVLHDEIFAPLGMKNTSMRYVKEEIAPLYSFDAETRTYKSIDRHLVYQLSPNYDSGGAGVIGNMEDLSLFLDAIACGGVGHNGYRLLSEESLKEMRKDQVAMIAKENTFGCCAGDCYGYGLGVRTRITEGGEGTSPVGEFGWDGAAGSYELCDPVNGISVTFITHVLNWPSISPTFSSKIRDSVYEDLLEK